MFVLRVFDGFCCCKVHTVYTQQYQAAASLGSSSLLLSNQLFASHFSNAAVTLLSCPCSSPVLFRQVGLSKVLSWAHKGLLDVNEVITMKVPLMAPPLPCSSSCSSQPSKPGTMGAASVHSSRHGLTGPLQQVMPYLQQTAPEHEHLAMGCRVLSAYVSLLSLSSLALA